MYINFKFQIFVFNFSSQTFDWHFSYIESTYFKITKFYFLTYFLFKPDNSKIILNYLYYFACFFIQYISIFILFLFYITKNEATTPQFNAVIICFEVIFFLFLLYFIYISFLYIFDYFVIFLFLFLCHCYHFNSLHLYKILFSWFVYDDFNFVLFFFFSFKK